MQQPRERRPTTGRIRQRETDTRVEVRVPVHVYDLRECTSSSNGFYAAASRFADEVLATVETKAGPLLDGCCRHVQEFLDEAPRSRGEYAIEFLMLGMALRRYEGTAEQTPGWVIGLADRLIWLRERSQIAKPVVDWLRAGIARFAFAPRIDLSARKTGSAVERLARLVAWLHATGEFNQESIRLDRWRGYLAQMRPEEATYWSYVAEELFDEFEWDAEETLGCYTTFVTPFVKRGQLQPRWREDLLFRSRTAAEYHLNMVAAEVMNWGLRDDFERTPSKVVLVPTCMRANCSACRARVDGLDISCTGCDPECAVNRITQRMRAEGIAVHMVPHAHGFSRVLKRWEQSGTGVAAVACLLNIVPGGFEMRERRISSQCVPLDFPGCRKHWDEQGFPTAMNEERLVQIISR